MAPNPELFHRRIPEALSVRHNLGPPLDPADHPEDVGTAAPGSRDYLLNLPTDLRERANQTREGLRETIKAAGAGNKPPEDAALQGDPASDEFIDAGQRISEKIILARADPILLFNLVGSFSPAAQSEVLRALGSNITEILHPDGERFGRTRRQNRSHGEISTLDPDDLSWLADTLNAVQLEGQKRGISGLLLKPGSTEKLHFVYTPGDFILNAKFENGSLPPLNPTPDLDVERSPSVASAPAEAERRAGPEDETTQALKVIDGTIRRRVFQAKVRGRVMFHGQEAQAEGVNLDGGNDYLAYPDGNFGDRTQQLLAFRDVVRSGVSDPHRVAEFVKDLSEAHAWGYYADPKQPNLTRLVMVFPVRGQDIVGRPYHIMNVFLSLPTRRWEQLRGIIDKDPSRAEEFYQISTDGLDQSVDRIPSSKLAIVDLERFIPLNKFSKVVELPQQVVGSGVSKLDPRAISYLDMGKSPSVAAPVAGSSEAVQAPGVSAAGETREPGKAEADAPKPVQMDMSGVFADKKLVTSADLPLGVLSVIESSDQPTIRFVFSGTPDYASALSISRALQHLPQVGDVVELSYANGQLGLGITRRKPAIAAGVAEPSKGEAGEAEEAGGIPGKLTQDEQDHAKFVSSVKRITDHRKQLETSIDKLDSRERSVLFNSLLERITGSVLTPREVNDLVGKLNLNEGQARDFIEDVYGHMWRYFHYQDMRRYRPPDQQRSERSQIAEQEYGPGEEGYRRIWENNPGFKEYLDNPKYRMENAAFILEGTLVGSLPLEFPPFAAGYYAALAEIRSVVTDRVAAISHEPACRDAAARVMFEQFDNAVKMNSLPALESVARRAKYLDLSKVFPEMDEMFGQVLDGAMKDPSREKMERPSSRELSSAIKVLNNRESGNLKPETNSEDAKKYFEAAMVVGESAEWAVSQVAQNPASQSAAARETLRQIELAENKGEAQRAQQIAQLSIELNFGKVSPELAQKTEVVLGSAGGQT